jgi:hypothetical protein
MANKKELQAALDEKGIEYSSSATNAELETLLVHADELVESAPVPEEHEGAVGVDEEPQATDLLADSPAGDEEPSDDELLKAAQELGIDFSNLDSEGASEEEDDEEVEDDTGDDESVEEYDESESPEAAYEEELKRIGADTRSLLEREADARGEEYDPSQPDPPQAGNPNLDRVHVQTGQLYTDGLGGEADHDLGRAYVTPPVGQPSYSERTKSDK